MKIGVYRRSEKIFLTRAFSSLFMRRTNPISDRGICHHARAKAVLIDMEDGREQGRNEQAITVSP
jgi:hypothetical protein